MYSLKYFAYNTLNWQITFIKTLTITVQESSLLIEAGREHKNVSEVAMQFPPETRLPKQSYLALKYWETEELKSS